MYGSRQSHTIMRTRPLDDNRRLVTSVI